MSATLIGVLLKLMVFGVLVHFENMDHHSFFFGLLPGVFHECQFYEIYKISKIERNATKIRRMIRNLKLWQHSNVGG